MSNFGRHLKAYRLGYGFQAKFGAFMRISDTSDGYFYVELVPENEGKFIMNRFPHRVWWNEDDGILKEDIVKSSPVLSKIKSIKTCVCFILREDGDFL